MKKTIYTLIASTCITIAATLIARAQAGSLDLTFDSDGIVTTDFANGSDYGRSVALQSDGKIVIAGYTDNGLDFDFALIRYSSDGSLDSTFGLGGKVTTPIGLDNDAAHSVAIQGDGKIVVAGSSGIVSYRDFALVRYSNDGNLDSTFDSDGKVTTEIGSADDVGYSVAIQGDGKIVVAGWSWNGLNTDFALVRYNSDGSLDNSFGLGGKITTSIGIFNDSGHSVAIQSNGKIVVAGWIVNGNDYDIALARYNSNGSLDNSFGSSGKVTTAVGSADDVGYSVAIQDNGKIVVAGWSTNGFYDNFMLVRYNSDGSLDNTFDSDGKVTTVIGSENDWGFSVAIQSDGKIVVAGNNYNGSNYDFLVVRYNADSAVGIAENIAGQSTIYVSPNPFANEITLNNSGSGKVVIFDMMGKEILHQKTLNTKTVINTALLASGLYLLHYTEGNKTENIKVVKF